MVKRIVRKRQESQPRGNDRQYENGNSTDFKVRKISGSARSKWKHVSSPVQHLVMSWLEDSILNISGQQTQAERTIKSIKTNVIKKLKRLKVPQNKCLDVKSVRTSKEVLESAKKRCDNTESQLKLAIEMEEKEVQQLQDEVDQMKGVIANWHEQLHPTIAEFLM